MAHLALVAMTVVMMVIVMVTMMMMVAVMMHHHVIGVGGDGQRCKAYRKHGGGKYFLDHLISLPI